MYRFRLMVDGKRVAGVSGPDPDQVMRMIEWYSTRFDGHQVEVQKVRKAPTVLKSLSTDVHGDECGCIKCKPLEEPELPTYLRR